MTGNYVRASELYSEGLEIARATGDLWFAALCQFAHTGVVSITLATVRPEDAREQWQSALAAWRAIGDPRMTALALNLLSWNALTLGRFDEARAALDESISLGRSIGDRYALGFAYRGLGIVMQRQGEHSEAVEIFRKSLETLTELGARQDVARVLAEMSRSVFELGKDAEAERILRESLRLANETQGTFIELEALVGMASLQVKRGEIEQALELLLAVLHHPAGLPETKNRAAHLRAELEVRLTKQQMETIQVRADAKTLATVVDEILQRPDSLDGR
jgi:tetratricopeptide (TPR) repeat protein